MKPLAEQLRPKSLKDFVGQENILGKDSLLKKVIKEDKIPSMIFYGPPGTGKTTLAKIIAKETKSRFEELSAVISGIKDVKEIIERAEIGLRLNEKTILFIDEIHRWNKKQQDVLLPYVENGTIVLIGATTENPSFEINKALLSRCRVFAFKTLEEKDIVKIIKRALKEKRLVLAKDALTFLKQRSGGDARTALSILEYASFDKKEITLEDVKEAFQKQNLYYDKDGKEHHDLISALIKSMRASEANAALYYLARMLDAGEDPLFIARRIVIFASEDVGFANSRALEQAVATYNACHFIGMPECRLNLTQAVLYMAKTNKSRLVYNAYSEAEKDVQTYGNLNVPAHLKNTGKEYEYREDLDYKEYLPSRIKNRKYFKELP